MINNDKHMFKQRWLQIYPDFLPPSWTVDKQGETTYVQVILTSSTTTPFWRERHTGSRHKIHENKITFVGGDELNIP